jgi:transcriptional regulator with XRE-family HTH domain
MRTKGRHNSNLILLRLYRGWEQQDVATELSLTLEEYQLLETAKERVTKDVALKLSDLYRVPPQLFLEHEQGIHFSFIYSHNTFNGSNGYVHNLYQETDKVIEIIRAAKDEEIQLLKNGIEHMRVQNAKLIELLLERINL